jgi:hypothetical protein
MNTTDGSVFREPSSIVVVDVVVDAAAAAAGPPANLDGEARGDDDRRSTTPTIEQDRTGQDRTGQDNPSRFPLEPASQRMRQRRRLPVSVSSSAPTRQKTWEPIHFKTHRQVATTILYGIM